jgi:hypothetical protein
MVKPKKKETEIEEGCEFCGLAENCNNYKLGIQAERKRVCEIIEKWIHDGKDDTHFKRLLAKINSEKK